jgi:hypothetical protein
LCAAQSFRTNALDRANRTRFAAAADRRSDELLL